MDDPVLAIELAFKAAEVFSIAELGSRSAKVKFTFVVGFLERVEELAAEKLRHRFDWKQVGFGGRHPTVLAQCQAATSDNAVEVNVVQQFLGPGV